MRSGSRPKPCRPERVFRALIHAHRLAGQLWVRVALFAVLAILVVLVAHLAAPLVPEERRLEVAERISAGGRVVQPLEPDEIARVVEAVRATAVDAYRAVLNPSGRFVTTGFLPALALPGPFGVVLATTSRLLFAGLAAMAGVTQ